MTRELYPAIWGTIEEKLDKVYKENDDQELILIGGYNSAELAFGRKGAAVLLDEYLEGNYDNLDIDRDADYNKQVEQMIAEVKKGCRFGDYQEIISFATRLEELQWYMSDIQSPASLVSRDEYRDLTRVCINGRTADLYPKIARELESFVELDDYLEELEQLEDTWY